MKAVRRLLSRPISTVGTLIAPDRTQQEANQIVTEGLVGHWDAGNPYSYIGSGTSITDLSGSGNNGTLNNSPTFLADRGGLLSLDGTDDNINFGRGSSLTIADNISVVVWIRFPSNYGKTGWQTLVSKRTPFNSSGGNRSTIIINYNYTAPSHNLLQLQYYSPNGTDRNISVVLETEFPTETWHCIAGVLEKSGTNTVLRLFKNGVQIQSGTSAGNVLSHSDLDLRIGSIDTSYNAPFGYEYGTFTLGQALVYNRALSAAELYQNFQATRWRFGI